MPDTRFITEFDQYLFGQGTHYDLYNKLGAHPMTVDGEEGVYFAVWAPNAAAVSIVGDFNEWDENATPMERLEPLGIYQIFLTGIKVGDIYKYCVTAQDGKKTLKADPYGFQAELRPNNASVVADISDFKWHDSRWMKKREKFDDKKKDYIIVFSNRVYIFISDDIRVPGKSMNRQKKMRMDSIITERLHMSWQLM